MSLSLVTAPALEPLSVAEAKLHARIDDDADDTLLASLIQAARQYVESYLGRQLVTATWRLTLDEFPCWELLVPLPPLQSVTSVVYLDSLGVSQTLSASQYVVDPYSHPGRITPAYGLTWPTTRQQINAVTVTFVAGYGLPVAVPEPIKHAMRMLISHWNENREAVLAGTISKPIEFAVQSLLTSQDWGNYR